MTKGLLRNSGGREAWEKGGWSPYRGDTPPSSTHKEMLLFQSVAAAGRRRSLRTSVLPLR